MSPIGYYWVDAAIHGLGAGGRGPYRELANFTQRTQRNPYDSPEVRRQPGYASEWPVLCNLYIACILRSRVVDCHMLCTNMQHIYPDWLRLNQFQRQDLSLKKRNILQRRKKEKEKKPPKLHLVICLLFRLRPVRARWLLVGIVGSGVAARIKY